jgi:uncharacterized membrane protein YfcA
MDHQGRAAGRRMQIADLTLLVAAGLTAGTVNSVAGGGSLVTFPALVATGMNPVPANVTNSVGVSFGFLGSIYGSRMDLDAASRQRLRSLVPTAIVGTALGCLLLLATPSRAFDLVSPFLVLAAAGVLAFADRIRRIIGHPADVSPRRRAVTLHTTVGLGSIYGGYFGAALSIVLVSVLGLVLDEPLRRINAHKNVLSAVIGFVTLVAFGLFGPVNWADVAILTPTTMIGGYLGARFARRVPARILRPVIATYAGVIGLLLLWRAIG